MPVGAAYLAIDLGASSGRAVLGSLDGTRMRAREVHRFRTPLVEDGEHLVWDIDALWNEVRVSLARAFEDSHEIRSVSIDSWAVDYVPLDAQGDLVRRPYSYRDPRTRGRLEHVLRRLTADELYEITGIQFLALNTLSQVVADVQEEPALVERTATRLTIADYLLARLSGVAAIERTMASTTQLYDVRNGVWSDRILKVIGDRPARWPRIVEPGTKLGDVMPGLLPSGTRSPAVIATCSHDTGAAVAAVPALGDSPWAYICSGTWSLVGAELPAPILGAHARAAGFTNEVGLDGTIRFLKNRTGTWILEECVREWSESGSSTDWNDLMREAEAAERPGFLIDCNASAFAERGGMVAKIGSACAALGEVLPSSRGALVRLVLESLADSYRQALSELESLIGNRVSVVHVVGGGSRNALLNQLTADACGRRVVAGPAEATALGNLLVQARTLGDLPPGVSIRDAARASTSTFEYLPQRSIDHRAISTLTLTPDASLR